MSYYELKNKEKVYFRLLQEEDTEKLFQFYDHLSESSKKRFRPHEFDKDTIASICHHIDFDHTIRFVAETEDKTEVIAYGIFKRGYLPHEIPRLTQYDFSFDHEKDYTFAPAVADAYQSKGLGSALFSYTMEKMKEKNANKIILWGGVQADNNKAVNFYLKHGFNKLGEFHYQGNNFDMIKYL